MRVSRAFSKSALLCATALAATVSGAPALAQAGDAPAIENEVITVTAQRREQSILDVPISLTAFTEEDIEAGRIQSVEDVLLVSPGVQYQETSDFLKTVSVRGINDSVGGLWQTTGVTVDDATLVATYNGFLLTSRLFDVERIEVLRGPQGALTGSNSTSGTINIITNKPDVEAFAAEGVLDIGRFGSTLVRGVVNAPLSPDFAVRAVAYLEDTDGSLENWAPAGGGSTEEHVGARLAARWTPTERLTLDLSASFEDQDFGAPNSLGLDAPGYDDPANDGAFWAERYRRNVNALESLGGSYAASSFLNVDGLNGGHIFSDLNEFTTHDIWSATARATYELDRHEVTATYTRYEHDVATLFDEDKSEYALVWSGWDGGPKSDFAEVRVTSDYAGPFNWVGGAAYMRERRVLDLRYDITEAFLAAYFGVGDVAALDDDSFTYFTDYWSHTLEQIESTALFANGFWDVTDRLHLSAGGRLSFVETATQSQYDASGVFGPFDDPVTADEVQFDPRVAINFDLSDDVTTYVQYATGHRSGYGNTGPGVELGIAPAEVEGEKLANYEVGLKGRFLDDRLLLSAAAFYMDYSDMQVSRTVAVAPPSTIGEVDFDDNVNSARSIGFEAEGSMVLAEGLVVSASASYVDSTIDELDVDGTIYTDLAFPSVSPWTVDASLDYARPITDGLDGVFRAEYSYRDGYLDSFEFNGLGPVGDIPSYNLVDFSLGLRADAWSATAYVENAFDETYWQGVYLSYATRGAVAPYNARVFGVRLTAQR